MATIGTPMSPTATKVVLCGSGELGKEFVIELQRYGVEVIALDKYANAPAMQVADRSYVDLRCWMEKHCVKSLKRKNRIILCRK